MNAVEYLELKKMQILSQSSFSNAANDNLSRVDSRFGKTTL